MIETNEISDALVSRIRKLLQLSTSDNPEEAARALEKAKKWATEADIELSSIELFKDQKQEPIKQDNINLGRRKSICQNYVSQILINHFNVRVLYHGSRWSGMQLIIIGKKKDIEIATYLNNFLNREFMAAWHKYYAENPVLLSKRASFLFGVKQGLNEKLLMTKQSTEKEKFEEIKVQSGEVKSAEIQNNYSLMVVSAEKRLDDATDDFYPHLRKNYQYQRNITCGNTISSGREAGKKIQIFKGISGGKSTNSLT